jgi:hypothetical protein
VQCLADHNGKYFPSTATDTKESAVHKITKKSAGQLKLFSGVIFFFFFLQMWELRSK